MRRRDLLAMPLVAGSASAAAGPIAVDPKSVRLKLKHTWTTTMSSSDYRDTLHLTLHRGGVSAFGEGAPIVRYKETAAEGVEWLKSLTPELEKADWRQFSKLLGQIFERHPEHWAAKSALANALMDWNTKNFGVPVYQYFGLDPKDAPLTTFSIGIDTPEMTRQKTKEADAYPVLKVKVGLDTDEATIEAVRSVTRKPLRVDANEGWKDKDEVVRKINWLEKQGVEFIEQPMPAHMLEDMNYIRKRVHMPIIADEACLHPQDIPKLANYFDGVNIKLDKCGGILEAYRMIQIAKSLGLKTMLGCMISSSAAVTAAAQLSPMVDYADLDGNLLISNDPFQGVTVVKGKLVLPSGPGLGLRKI